MSNVRVRARLLTFVHEFGRKKGKRKKGSRVSLCEQRRRSRNRFVKRSHGRGKEEEARKKEGRVEGGETVFSPQDLLVYHGLPANLRARARRGDSDFLSARKEGEMRCSSPI